MAERVYNPRLTCRLHVWHPYRDREAGAYSGRFQQCLDCGKIRDVPILELLTGVSGAEPRRGPARSGVRGAGGGTVNVSKIRAGKKVAKEVPQERGRSGPI